MIYASQFKSLKKILSCNFKSFSFQIQQNKDFLRLQDTASNNHYDFHYIWLRHNCRCLNGCTHPKTNEKTLKTSEFPSEIKPISTKINQNNIEIQWEGGHVSSFTTNYLIDNNYSKNREDNVRPQNFTAEDVTLDYSDFKNDLVTYKKKIHEILNKHGVFVVRNFGTDTEQLISDFGGRVIESHFGRIEDLRTNNTTNKNTDQLGYTNAAVDLHTDLPFIENPPRYQSLQCIQPAAVGGDNFFVNAKQIGEYLKSVDPIAYYLLTTVKVKFFRRQKAYQSCFETPIIKIGKDNEIEIIRSSYFTTDPFNVDFHLMKEWYRAFNLFQELCEKNKIQVSLRQGDFVLYDNYLMFHARNEFNGNRFYRGVYFDDQDVKSSLNI